MMTWTQYNNFHKATVVDWMSHNRQARIHRYKNYVREFEEMKLSYDDFVKAKKALEKANVPGSYFSLGNTSLPSVVESTPTSTTYHWAPQQEQGNNPMNYAYNNTAAATIVADTSEKDKRRYLADRLSTLRYQKVDEVNKSFGFGPIDYPKSAKEALERIQAGKFIIVGADKDEKPRWGFDFYDAFSWRDPSVKQDEDGRDKALEDLNDFIEGLNDVVMVKPIDEAFDTLKALQDWQPTGKPN